MLAIFFSKFSDSSNFLLRMRLGASQTKYRNTSTFTIPTNSIILMFYFEQWYFCETSFVVLQINNFSLSENHWKAG